MKKNTKFLLIITLFIGIVIVAIRCTNLESTASGFTIPSSYTMPYEVGPNPDDGLYSNYEALAQFAWQEMIALNWKSTYAVSGQRDQPDNSWSYDTEGTPDYVVWETFAHRTELRPATPTFDGDLPPLQGKPHYSFGKSSTDTVALVKASGDVSLDLLNCLDEDNEIGSSILFAHASGDLSSLGGDNDNQVLYQAKINKIGYDYRRQNFPQKGDLATAAAKVLGTNGGADANKLKGKTASCESQQLTSEGYICFPCADEDNEGVIEIKTAWRKARPDDTLSNYFHRNAIYFTEVSDASATVHNDIYLLIGMHIIHKTKDVPTFVIATFEHENLRSNDYYFLATPGGDADYNELYQIKSASSVPRNAKSSVFQPVNEEVHQALAATKANTYLQHYNLVGVQGRYVDGYVNTDERDAASFKLSNYVIETDAGLANFYGSFGVPQRGPADGFFNTINISGDPIVTGGCKGCHGVAQTTGTDMSFLLDNTKPADMPDEASLAQDVIVSQYLMPGQIAATPDTGAVAGKTRIFFSYFENGQDGYYVNSYNGDGIGASNPYLGLYAYNSSFRDIDLDGFPKTNLVINSYQPLIDGNGVKGTITLKLANPDGSFSNISLADVSGQEVLTAAGGTPSTFILEKSASKYGFAQLFTSDGKPVIVSPDNTHPLVVGQTGAEAAFLGVDYFPGQPYPTN